MDVNVSGYVQCIFDKGDLQNVPNPNAETFSKTDKENHRQKRIFLRVLYFPELVKSY